MFKKEEGGEIETVIGPSVQVEGNFVAAGDVIVEGTVAGSLKTEKNLRIGQGARIFANVSAANALIAGEVQGDVKIKESLELTGTAKIFGDIKTKVLTINAGACLNGRCVAGDDKKTRLEKIEEKEKQERSKNKEKIINEPERI